MPDPIQQFRLPKAWKKFLVEEAKRRGESVSAMIRYALRCTYGSNFAETLKKKKRSTK